MLVVESSHKLVNNHLRTKTEYRIAVSHLYGASIWRCCYYL